MTHLGTPTDRDGTLVWSGAGRPLSSHELKMRERCGHLWLPLFEGTYRLARTLEARTGFEDAHQRSSLSFYGLVKPPAGKSTLWRERVTPTHAQCLEIIRAAVAGGGKAVLRGEVLPVSAAQADTLVDFYLASAPVETLLPIVAAIIGHEVDGTAPTPEEQAAFTIPAGDPVVPAWALAA